MLTNKEIQKKYIEYLKEAGVDIHIISYLERNPYLVRGKLRELIGEDLYPMYKDRNIETLKNGTDTFRITEDGEIWWKDENIDNNSSQHESKIKISGVTHSFSHGHSFLTDPNRKRSSHYNHIAIQDEHIIHRELTIDSCLKDNEQYYNGNIVESVINGELDLEEKKEASWEHSESSTIPSKELVTGKKIYGKGYFKDSVEKRETYNKNFAEDLEWQFVATGETQGERLQSEIGEITKKSNILIDGIASFFNKLRHNTKNIEK